MAKYYIIPDNTPKFQRSYGLPLINIIPAIIWSIPLHQKLFPGANFWAILGICAAFVVLYIVVTLIPVICAVPDVAGAIIYIGLFWALVDGIGHDVIRIILKVLIAVFFGMLELTNWINSTLPWLELKFPGKPKIGRVE